MTTVLLVVLVVLAAGLLIVVSLAAQSVSQLRKSMVALERQIDGIQNELARQEIQISSLRKEMMSKKSDGFELAHEALARLRNRGVAQTLIWLGIRYFGSYFRGRPTKKQLPPGQGKEQ